MRAQRLGACATHRPLRRLVQVVSAVGPSGLGGGQVRPRGDLAVGRARRAGFATPPAPRPAYPRRSTPTTVSPTVAVRPSSPTRSRGRTTPRSTPPIPAASSIPPPLPARSRLSRSPARHGSGTSQRCSAPLARPTAHPSTSGLTAPDCPVWTFRRSRPSPAARTSRPAACNPSSNSRCSCPPRVNVAAQDLQVANPHSTPTTTGWNGSSSPPADRTSSSTPLGPRLPADRVHHWLTPESIRAGSRPGDRCRSPGPGRAVSRSLLDERWWVRLSPDTTTGHKVHKGLVPVRAAPLISAARLTLSGRSWRRGGGRIGVLSGLTAGFGKRLSENGPQI